MTRRVVRVFVRGRVQGVGYRAFAAREAERRGLDGFVRNRADGRVEALAAGPAAGIEAFLAALRRGPRAGRVDEVLVEEAADDSGPDGFFVAPTL